MRFFISSLILIGSMFFVVGDANAVTHQGLANTSYELTLSSSASIRARTDVQIRRIKLMMTNRQTAPDAAIDWIKKLQINLRGQK